MDPIVEKHFEKCFARCFPFVKQLRVRTSLLSFKNYLQANAYKIFPRLNQLQVYSNVPELVSSTLVGKYQVEQIAAAIANYARYLDVNVYLEE